MGLYVLANDFQALKIYRQFSSYVNGEWNTKNDIEHLQAFIWIISNQISRKQLILKIKIMKNIKMLE